MLDIGANTGQFALELRYDMGYAGRIISFEPTSGAFSILKKAANSDPLWNVYNYALGDKDEMTSINISENSLSSSLAEMLPSHVELEPKSKYIGQETICLKSLDSLFPSLCVTAKNIYMKIDTQGFEEKVLRGAKVSLCKIDTIQMEMSLVPLYKNEMLFNDMCVLMNNRGYTLIGIENGFTDPTSGHLLQVDGIFRRS